MVDGEEDQHLGKDDNISWGEICDAIVKVLDTEKRGGGMETDAQGGVEEVDKEDKWTYVSSSPHMSKDNEKSSIN